MQVIENYRRWAEAEGLHAMSGRKAKSATAFVNSLILEFLAPAPGHRVVDVGCGDGSLISSLSSATCIGIVPTQEECQRLRLEYHTLSRLRFEVGLAQAIPLKAESADRVVCNGVLRLLPSFEVIDLAVAELARIAAKGGLVWIGEVISFNDEAMLAVFGSRWLGRYAYKISTLNVDYIKYSNKQIKHFRKKNPIVIDREAMVSIANKHGLSLVWDGPHLYSTLFCPVRRNYLFSKH